MKKIFSLLFFLPLLVWGQSPDKNYVKTKTYKKPSTGTITAADTIVHVTYYDGLGRPIQTNALQAGGDGQNIITPIIYDALGRQSRNYLPFAYPAQATPQLNYNLKPNDNIIANIESYYATNYPEDLPSGHGSSDPNPYSETFYEASPLNRPVKQAAPGTAWKVGTGNNDHTIKFNYDANVANEVYDFRVTFPHNGNTEKPELTLAGYFPAGKLYKKVVKDENWTPADGKNKTTEEFTNGEGQTILKRTYNEGQPHDTYYVYDKYSNLTYVIPPLAADDIATAEAIKVPLGRNFPWVRMTRVDTNLAEAYERDLAEYDNSEILNADLLDMYGGQGGFSLASDAEGNLSLGLNITTAEPMPLKTGSLIDLNEFGKFIDRELGRLSGTGYEYIFLVKSNWLHIEGEGNMPSVNATLDGGQKLEYSQNYPWTALCEADAEVARIYDADIAALDNSEILNTYTPNTYGAKGGVAVSLSAGNQLSISLNIVATDSLLQLRQGMLFPLNIQRRIPDMELGAFQGDGYSYSMRIRNNSLHVVGTGLFNNLTFTALYNVQINYTIRQEVVEGLCYIYHYDKRNRVIEKHIPGKGWEHIVYDKLDRPILVQDENLRVKAQYNWLFTKYDKFGRVAYTGQYTDLRGRGVIQAERDAVTGPVLYESRTATSPFTGIGKPVYYTNAAFPTVNVNPLALNYYDDYSFSTNGMPQTVYGAAVTTNTKGLSTGSVVRVLGTNHWITTRIGYDGKGRAIWSHKQDTYLGYTENAQMELDFTGKVTETKTVHNKQLPAGTESTTIFDYYTYDHLGRPLRHTQRDNTKPLQLIAWNKYDELGQLEQKKVGGSYTNTIYSTYSNTAALQTVDYRYNIRGWLRGINDTAGNLATGNDLFAFKINYNTKDLTGSTQMYNGNIAETHWKTKNDNKLRSYSYTYDAMNRLNDADYIGSHLLPNTTETENYTEGEITYDKNGNILALERWGLKEGTAPEIDKIDILSYTYFPYSNQLKAVADNAGNDGFKDGTNSGDDYAYDDNGNMVKDLNKEIGTATTAGITYNHLNLPVKITFSATKFIEYVYDAMGTKLQKKVTDGANITTTQYNGGFVYEKVNSNPNVLQFFGQPEGYVTKDVNGNFSYVYQYTDHLGNVRLSYTDADKNGSIAAGEIIEESNYYAFGLQHSGYNAVVGSLGNSVAQKWQYNNREWQEEFKLHLTAMDYRPYDNALGRFHSTDALSEFAYSISPYRFAYNNPLYWNDPTGLFETESAAYAYINKYRLKGATVRSTGEGGAWAVDSGAFTIYQSGDHIYANYIDGDAVMSMIVNRPGGGGGGGNITLSGLNNYVGLGAYGLENTRGSVRFSTSSRGFSPKYYGNSWGGNQYAKTFNISNIGKVVGDVSFFAGVFFDGVGVSNYYSEGPDSAGAVHPGKATLNTGMGAYGIWVNPPAGVVYSIMETFYPGGAQGYINDTGKTQVDVFNATGWHNQNRIIPFGPK